MSRGHVEDVSSVCPANVKKDEVVVALIHSIMHDEGKIKLAQGHIQWPCAMTLVLHMCNS